MALSTLLHNQRKIIYADYSDCNNKDEMMQLARELTAFLLEQPEKEVLVLFDYTDTYLSSEFMKVVKEEREKFYRQKTAKGAALGVTGIKKVLLKGYNALSRGAGIQLFDTKLDALNYLTR